MYWRNRRHRAAIRVGLVTALTGISAAGGLVLVAQPASAGTTINVTTTIDEFDNSDPLTGCSLREAVQAANTDTAFGGCPTGSGQDEIALPDGVFVLTRTGAGEDANATGDLDISNGVDIHGTGVGSTVIDGNGTDRIVNGLVGAGVIGIDHLTLRNGNTFGARDESGGAVRIEGTATLTSVAITGSRQGDHGAVYADKVYVTDSIVTDNHTTSDGTALGGGIAATTLLWLTGTTVTGNSVDGSGGGVATKGLSAQSLRIADSTISDNTATGSGGSGGTGGGVYARAATMTVTGNTFERNTASSMGGAIYVLSSPGSAYANRIAGNQAPTARGLYSRSAVDFSENWWGCDSDPTLAAPGCDTVDLGGGDVEPRIRLKLTFVPTAPTTVGDQRTVKLSFVLGDGSGNPPAVLQPFAGLLVTFTGIRTPATAPTAADATVGIPVTFDHNSVLVLAEVDHGLVGILAEPLAKAATATEITSISPSPSVVGQAVTIGYKVTAPLPATGDVTIDDGVNTCTAPVSAGECTITSTSAGTRTFTAYFNGDADFELSHSASSNHTVNRAATRTDIGVAPGALSRPGPVTVNFGVAVLSPGVGTATGTVTVTDGSTTCTATVAIGHCDLVVGGEGTHVLRGSYSGDANFAPSTSGDLSTTIDATPPTVTVPADITTGATSPTGTIVRFTATAADLVDGSLSPVCVPASGSVFPIGATTVRCTATDNAGNTGARSFKVTVTGPDGTPAITGLTVPDITRAASLPITATATAPTGAAITGVSAWIDSTSGFGTALTVGPGGSPVTVSGSLDITGLGDGNHILFVRATDDFGNTGQLYAAAFLVDRTAPTLAPVVTPNPVVRNRTAAVTPNAADARSGLATVTCGPVPTATLGAKTVSCTATDRAGNTATASAAYTVIAATTRPADVTTSIATSRTTVGRNGTVTVTIRVRNTGPGTAARTRPSLTYNPTRLTPTALNGGVLTGSTITWLAGDVRSGATRTFTATFRAVKKGTTTLTSTVVSAVPDPDLADNRAARTITIT